MLVKTYGGAVQGIDAIKITIEVNLDIGTKIVMVGLPDNAVKWMCQKTVNQFAPFGDECKLQCEDGFKAEKCKLI